MPTRVGAEAARANVASRKCKGTPGQLLLQNKAVQGGFNQSERCRPCTFAMAAGDAVYAPPVIKMARAAFILAPPDCHLTRLGDRIRVPHTKLMLCWGCMYVLRNISLLLQRALSEQR